MDRIKNEKNYLDTSKKEVSTKLSTLQNTSQKNLLFVYPEIPNLTYWSFSKALRFVSKKSAFPPLGLATVASMLPPSTNIRILDMNVEKLKEKDLEWADTVFLSAMIVQKESFEKISRRCQERGIPVVAGGPYASTAFKELPYVDHFVIGEAENVINRFWKDFTNGETKKAYSRPATQAAYDEQREYFGEDADIELTCHYPDVNETPVPRFDLLKRKKYRSMSVQASRGCPIGCEFCDIWRRFGKKPRTKDPENMLRELDELHRLGWHGAIFVVDDNFIGNRKRARELLGEMARWQKEHGYPFQFFTEGTLTLADDEALLEGFRQAGFDMVFIGIETPSNESLKETHKLINTRGSIPEKVARIQSYGVQVTAGFILGFDNDPDDIREAMIKFIQDLGIPVAMVGLMQALPETDLFDRLAREGRLLSQASGNNTHSFATNFITKRPMKAVTEDYKEILRNTYPLSLSTYFERCKVLRERWNPPKHSSKVHLVDLLALVRYLLLVPFKSYRWSAFKFTVGTLFKKPAFFPIAMSLCMQGHHFREITRYAFEAEHVENFLHEKKAAFAKMVSQCIESTANSRTAFMEGYVHHRDEILKEYCQRRNEILKEARRKMNKLQKDARFIIHEEYERFANEIEDMYQKLTCMV